MWAMVRGRRRHGIVHPAPRVLWRDEVGEASDRGRGGPAIDVGGALVASAVDVAEGPPGRRVGRPTHAVLPRFEVRAQRPAGRALSKTDDLCSPPDRRI